MDPSTIILATVGLLVVSPFALVVWAQRENLAELRSLLLGLKKEPGGKRLDGVRLLFADDVVRAELKLESEYQNLQNDVTDCRKSVKLGIETGKELEGRCEAAKAKIERLERHLKRTPDDANKEKLAAKRLFLLELEDKLAKQKLETASARENLMTLESQVQNAYTKKQVLIATGRAAAATKQANKALAKSKKRQLARTSSIDALEASVLAREALLSKPRLQIPEPIDEASVAQAEKIIAKIASVGSVFHSITDLAKIADPSIEQAYTRVCDQLESARKLADLSIKEEEKIEKQVARYPDTIKFLQARADEVTKSGGTYADQVLQRIAHNEAALSDLSEALKIHRRKNFSIGQGLFRIEGFVRRLYVLKLLLSALPGSPKDEFAQYRNLVDAVCAFLQEGLQKQKAEEKKPVEFAQRLAALEHSCIIAYIRIARGDMQLLPASAVSGFQSKVATISKLLDEDLRGQRIELERWQSLAKQFTEENRDFVLAVASSRTEQCAAILKTTEQSLEVLSVTMSVLAERQAASQPKPQGQSRSPG